MTESLNTPSAAQAHLDRGFRFEQAGSVTRALESYNDAIAASGTSLDEAQARLRLARVLRSLSRWDEAVREAREAVRIALESRADDLAAEALNVEIGVHLLRGDFGPADELANRAMVMAQSARVRGITLQNRGSLAALRKDFSSAERLFAESVAAFRESEYDLGLAIALVNAAAAARDMDDAKRALRLSEEAADLCRRINALDVLLVAVQNQASALVALGQLDEAEARLTEALGHFTSARNPIRQAECLEIMGEMAARRAGDVETAMRCYGRARDLAVAAGDRLLAERLTHRIAGVVEPSPESTRVPSV
ncbi:MAG TPA: hypothetical protein VF159_12280 [Gemmatimonadaceae bacterium]